MDALDSRSHLPSSSSLRRSLTSVCRFHSLVPSNFDDSLEPAWLQEIAINRNRYGVTNLSVFSWGNDVQVFRQAKTLQPWILSGGVRTKTSPQNNARHPPRNGQARRRPVQLPGSNTRVSLDFIFKTLICPKLLYVAHV